MENDFKKSLQNFVILFVISLFLTIGLAWQVIPMPLDLSDDLNSKCQNAKECLEEIKQKIIGNIGTTTVEKNQENPERLRGFFGVPLSFMLFNVFLQNNGSFVQIEGKDSSFKGDPHFVELGCTFNNSSFVLSRDGIKYTRDQIRYDINGLEKARLIKSFNGCIPLLQQQDSASLEFPLDGTPTDLKWQRKILIILSPDLWSYLFLFVFSFTFLIALLELLKRTFLISKNGIKNYLSNVEI